MKGHIRRRGERSWAIVLDLGRDAEGKRVQKWHTVQGTKKEAERKLTEILHSMSTGFYVEPSKLTVGDFLDRWLTEYAQRQVSGKTYERYASIVKLHLKPELGNVVLSKLQPLQLEGAYTKWMKTGRKKKDLEGPQGLSPRTVLQHHRVLHKALKMAVRWQLLARNPADAVEPPRFEQKEIRPLDEAGTAWMLEFARGTRLYVPILFSVAVGTRRGETLALRWIDLDLEAGTVSVRRSIEQTKDCLRFKETKGKGARVLPLPSLLVEALNAHKMEQQKVAATLGREHNSGCLVFPNDEGGIWRPDNFTSAFVTLTEKSGLKGVRFHDLRHSHASQLLRQGVHPKIVQERLGHSGIAVTMDIYSHVLPGMQEKASQGFDDALRSAIKKLSTARPQ